MGDRRAHRVACVLAGAAWLLLVAIPLVPTDPSAAPVAAAGGAVQPFVHPFAYCPGPLVVPNVTGTVRVAASTPPFPSVKNVTVQLSYEYEIHFTPKVGAPTVTCTVGGVLAKTGPHGQFAENVSLPANSCSPSGCVTYAGPFGPQNLTLPGFSTPGYFVTAAIRGANATVGIVQALASTALTPSGRATVSVNAPTVVQAAALAGDGEPSPAAVGFAWSLTGSGWSFVGEATGAAVTVLAAPGANPASLTVWTNGTYGALNVSSPPTDLQLSAVATTVVAGSLVPTALDAETPATFALDGVGSGGYLYTAQLAPGLGTPSVGLPCTTHSIAGGEVDVHCSGTATFPLAGTAQPTANLSNGYSTAQWTYPQVVISPSLALLVLPQPAVAYRGASVQYTVSIVPGSGTAPYGPVCLWTGDGRSTCSAKLGASWATEFSYASAGLFEGHATVMDAAGTNRSLPVVTQIVDRPHLSNLTASTNALVVGGSANLTSLLTGGAFPVSYWWNASLPSSTVASGVRIGPGAFALTFTMNTPGLTVVTLTVSDQLGTRVAVTVDLEVTAGPAVAVDPVGGLSGDTLSAGIPFPVSFVAADPFAERVTTFAGPMTLTLTGPGGAIAPAAVNSSSLGPLARTSDGGFVLDASAWLRGYLNVTVDVYASGPVLLGLTSVGTPLAAGPTSWRLWVTEDAAHLRLFAPHVVRSAGWFNDTVWRIDDRFGNPATGSYVIVQSRFGGVVTNIDSLVEMGVDGGTQVWVNYSSAGTAGGIVNVLDQFGDALLAPLTVPAPPVESFAWPLVGVAGGAVLLGTAVTVVVVRRRLTRARGPSSSLAGEDELRRFAEGRSHVLAQVPPEGDVDLESIARGYPGTPPSPAELTEWVASLVTEGALAASVGPDGRPRFRRAPPKLPEPRPRVEVDPAALDSALAYRDEPDRAGGDGEGRG